MKLRFAATFRSRAQEHRKCAGIVDGHPVTKLQQICQLNFIPCCSRSCLCLDTQTAPNGGRYDPFRRLVSYREFDPVIHGKPATAGFMANPEGCVMCDELEGAAGTPPRPGRYSVLPRFSYQAGFFRSPDGIRPRYDWPTIGYGRDTVRIRTGYEQGTADAR